MFECYNIGVNYLIKKYGEIPAGRGSVTFKNGKNTKHKDGTIVMKMNHDDEEVRLLLQQYYLGIKVKEELYWKLVFLNVIKHKES